MRREPKAEAGEAWAAFYEQNRRAITVYALSLARQSQDALDLVQEALLRAVAAGVEPRVSRSYFFRTLRNLAVDAWRAEGRRSRALPRVAVRFLCEPPDDSAGADELRRVREALNTLADGPREVLVLKVYSGLTFAEIAGILDRPAGTVASWYARAVGSLRETLLMEMPDVP